MATGYCADDCKNYKNCSYAKGSTKVPSNCKDFEE